VVHRPKALLADMGSVAARHLYLRVLGKPLR
jgi:hypothetical protein